MRRPTALTEYHRKEKDRTIMAKKVWISLPLITSCEAGDASVVSFLKGGTKKDLEVEVAAFITKWLMDRDVPFSIDFDSCGVDRTLVIESLPKRLQKILGATAAVVAEAGEAAPSEESAVDAETGAVEDEAEAAEAGEELHGGHGDPDGSSGLR